MTGYLRALLTGTMCLSLAFFGCAGGGIENDGGWDDGSNQTDRNIDGPVSWEFDGKGGTLTGKDATVVVSPGALVGPATVTIDRTDLPADVPAATSVVDDALSIQVDGEENLDEPLTVTVGYDDHGITEESGLLVLHYTGQRYEPVTILSHDPEANTVTFESRTFTEPIFVVVEVVAALPEAHATGFDPARHGFGTDDIGHTFSPIANRIGMSAYAVWFFMERDEDLSGRFGPEAVQTLAGRVQLAQSQHWVLGRSFEKQAMPHRQIAELIKAYLYVTGQPLMLMPGVNGKGERATVVYAYDAEHLYVYDARLPGAEQQVSFDGMFLGTRARPGEFGYGNNEFIYLANASTGRSEDYRLLTDEAESGFPLSDKIQLLAPAAGQVVVGQQVTVRGSLASDLPGTGSLLATDKGVWQLASITDDLFEFVAPVSNGPHTLLLVAGVDVLHQANWYHGAATLVRDFAGDNPGGDLFANLSWDQPESDLDLYVTEPEDGETVWSGQTQASSGLAMQLSDATGFGPEVVTLHAADGAQVREGLYLVRVHARSESGPVSGQVTIVVNEGTYRQAMETVPFTIPAGNPVNTDPGATGPDWVDLAEVDVVNGFITCLVCGDDDGDPPWRGYPGLAGIEVDDEVSYFFTGRPRCTGRCAELKAKYGTRPRKYKGLFNCSMNAEIEMVNMLPDVTAFVNGRLSAIGYDFDVTEAEIATNFLAEGGILVIMNDMTDSIDGFGAAGIDTLVDNYPALKPYLPESVRTAVEGEKPCKKCPSDNPGTSVNEACDYAPCCGTDACDCSHALGGLCGERITAYTNEKGETVHTLTDLTLEEVLYANAGMYAWGKAQAAADMRRLGVNMQDRPRDDQFWWGTVYFNAGSGLGRRTMNKRGVDYCNRKWTQADDHYKYGSNLRYNATWRTATFELLNDTVYANGSPGPCGDMQCEPAQEIFCDADFSGSTVGLDSNISSYGDCSSKNLDGGEMAFKFTQSMDSLPVSFKVTSDSGTDLDLLVLENLCNGDKCENAGAGSGGTAEASFVHKSPNPNIATTYYVVVDSPKGQESRFNLEVECAFEKCFDGVDNDQDGQTDCDDENDCAWKDECTCPGIAGEISCGQTISGNTAGGSDDVDSYPACSTWEAWGPAVSYTFQNNGSSELTVELQYAEDLDMDVYLLGYGCGADDCVTAGAYGFSYPVDPDGSYFLVVDSWRDEKAGPFTLQIQCN